MVERQPDPSDLASAGVEARIGQGRAMLQRAYGGAVGEWRYFREWLAHRRNAHAYRRQRWPLADVSRPGPLLIGYFEVGFGLGQYARGLARALATVDEPFAVYPYSAFARRGVRDRSWAGRYDVDHVHDINIFCMAADQTGYAMRMLGRRRTEAAYNVLATFWELERAPEAWRQPLQRFDEIWAPNAFVADAMRAVFDGPISIVPTCVTLEETPRADMARFGLETGRFWFLFSFDYNSFPERKNPLGIVTAFRRAFACGDEPVGLVVKSNGDGERFVAIREAMEAAVREDGRIRLVHGELARSDMLSLMASTSSYVSLHRSEGFGLGMAEAMLMGLPVVGTAYSGNAEFLTEATGFPVPYKLQPIGQDAYPHAGELSWAEPDLDVAATILRDVVGDPGKRARLAAAGKGMIASNYAAEAVGRVAGARLAAIRQAIACRGAKP